MRRTKWMARLWLALSAFLVGHAQADTATDRDDAEEILKIVFQVEGGFPQGTPVITPRGPVPIEDVKVGDTLLSCDREEDTCVERRVETTFSYYTSALVRLMVAGHDGQNDEMLVAKDHLFFAADSQTWVPAADLQAGMKLLDADFGEASLVTTQAVNEKTLIYNFSVDEMHNYYAGHSKVLVHNFNPLSWLSEKMIHSGLTQGTFLAGLGSLASLLMVKAPYGRHFDKDKDKGWGPTLSNKLGWILMEVPSVVAFATTFYMGEHSGELAPQVMAGMWLAHYTYRTFIYPNLIQTKGKEMPLSLALTGAAFNTVNSYINARSLSHFTTYPDGWLGNPRFILGAIIFAVGMGINISSDQILINLRKPGETGYKIPEGGLFRYVSCPNYLGEIMEWLGWAVASFDPGKSLFSSAFFSEPGAAFSFYTLSNLLPRALTNHKWYQDKFGKQYPPERTALVPGVL